MTDDEVKEILQTIIELARSIGWTAAMAQTKNGEMIGMYLGPRSWIDSKSGVPTITH